MTEVTDPLAWVARAEEDLLLARSAVRRKRPLTSGASFHAQQCAEKYSRALLVAQGRAFPKIHDLDGLADLCRQAGVPVPVSKDKLDVLSSHAVETRYRGREPTVEEAREAIETAKAVRRLGRRLLKLA